MKNFILILSSILFAINAFGQSKQVKFDGEILNGSIQSIKHTAYEYHTAYQNKEAPDKSKMRHYWMLQFDETGKNTRDVKFNSKKEVDRWITRTYQKDICIKEELYMILSSGEFRDTFLHKSIFSEMNVNQQPSKVTTYEDGTKMTSEATYIYNDKNQLIKVQGQDKALKIASLSTFKYNIKGLLSHTHQKNGKISFETSFEYLKFDARGNWIERIAFHSFFGKRVETRTISYF